MRAIIVWLLSVTVLAGCAGEPAQDVAVRLLSGTVLAACEAVPNCSSDEARKPGRN